MMWSKYYASPPRLHNRMSIWNYPLCPILSNFGATSIQTQKKTLLTTAPQFLLNLYHPPIPNLKPLPRAYLCLHLPQRGFPSALASPGNMGAGEGERGRGLIQTKRKEWEILSHYPETGVRGESPCHFHNKNNSPFVVSWPLLQHPHPSPPCHLNQALPRQAHFGHLHNLERLFSNSEVFHSNMTNTWFSTFPYLLTPNALAFQRCRGLQKWGSIEFSYLKCKIGLLHNNYF